MLLLPLLLLLLPPMPLLLALFPLINLASIAPPRRMQEVLDEVAAAG